MKKIDNFPPGLRHLSSKRKNKYSERKHRKMEFFVTNLDDSGAGSLRWAISNANSTAGFDSIRFDSAFAGGTISLLDSLPVITDRVSISGLIQDTSEPSIGIDFNGESGLTFRGGNAAGSSLSGFAIMDAGGNGLTLDANNITIQSNYIGLMLDGVTGSGNSGNGILITANSRDNMIGAFMDPITGLSYDSSFSNVISGNGGSGIFLEGANTNTISGNNISVTGDSNRGILVTESRANTSSISDLKIIDNMIEVNGAQTAGVEVVVSNGYLAKLDISGNKVSTDGAFLSHGIRVLASKTGSIGATIINDNDIITSGPLSEGIYLSSLDGASIGQATVNNNIVLTTGDVGSDSRNQYNLESDGIYVNALRNGSFGKLEISGNEVTTYGNDADGIYLIAGVDAVVSQALVSNNTVSTLASNPVQSNQAAEGIKILSYADSLIRVALYDNLILQSEGTGIQLKTQSGIRPNDGGSIFADVQGNTVINANSSGQIDASPYGASNPNNVGTITLVGERPKDVLSSNSPADQAAYSVTGAILFAPTFNARTLKEKSYPFRGRDCSSRSSALLNP
jgi:parallel beta-helix repeat protein